jgi:hypothetical protein
MPTVEVMEVALCRLGWSRRLAPGDVGILERQIHRDGTIAGVPPRTPRPNFWRRKIFPAGREIAVRQRYVPSLGSLSYGTLDVRPSQKAQAATWPCTEPIFEKKV